jgi:hypothetical protein
MKISYKISQEGYNYILNFQSQLWNNPPLTKNTNPTREIENDIVQQFKIDVFTSDYHQSNSFLSLFNSSHTN